MAAAVAIIIRLAVIAMRRPPQPPGHLVRAAREGDVWAAYVLARHIDASSATELVQAVWPDRPPSVGEADTLLDAWSLLRREREKAAARMGVPAM